jgi:CRP/FNR family transcriptional regulator
MAKRHSCTHCTVRSNALCRALSAQRLADLNRHSHRRRYPPGQLLTGFDAVQAWFAIIVSGVIKLTKSLPDGRQQIVALLFPSDFVGRPFGPSDSHAAETATAVELCCFSRQHFEALMHDQSELKQQFLERTLDELELARDWMLRLGRGTAQEKLAAFILLMWRRMCVPKCAFCARPQGQQFDLPLTRSEIGDYLGLRIETVSRQLKALQAAGAIETWRGRTISVRDAQVLERLTNGE